MNGQPAGVMPGPSPLSGKSSCSTLLAASALWPVTEPTATVRWPVRRPATVTLVSVTTVVELEVLTRTWVPCGSSTVNPPVVTPATVPLASPRASAGWKRCTGRAGAFRAGACAASELGVTPIRRAVICPWDLVPGHDHVHSIAHVGQRAFDLTGHRGRGRGAHPHRWADDRLDHQRAARHRVQRPDGQLQAAAARRGERGRHHLPGPAHTRGERGCYPQPPAAQNRHGYRGGRGGVPSWHTLGGAAWRLATPRPAAACRRPCPGRRSRPARRPMPRPVPGFRP